MNIRDLDGKKVCVLGYGREGQATYQALKHYAPGAEITIADFNPKVSGESDTSLISGPDYLDRLEGFDTIVKSPGINWHPQGRLQDTLTSATELFFDSLPEGVVTVGITGSSGKSTTANLIYQVLKAAGKPVHLAGNIGDPMLAQLSEAKAGSIFVLELSSYQLENLRTSPHVAVLTSFFPDHVDYHGSLGAYFEAKSQIARHQHPGDVIFYNSEYPECRRLAELSPGRREPFSAADAPRGIQGATVPSNLAAAYKVAACLGVPTDQIVAALKHAGSLPHRQQLVSGHGGIQWIDDSASKTPQATVAALAALGDRVDTLIVGGLDRDFDFTALGQAIAASPVRNVVLFPDTGAKIRRAVEQVPAHPAKHYLETSSMPEAVEFAAAHTAPAKVCLLSSGSPSYNLFHNFGERGQAFQEAVAQLAKR